jgi:hypothetical protein
MPQGEWDGESNEQPREENNPTISFGEGAITWSTINPGYTGISGVSGYSAYIPNVTFVTDDTVRISNTQFSDTGMTIGSPVLTIRSQETNINPTGLTQTHSRYTTPIQYTLNNQSWKYTFAFALSLIFGPWLCIWSKLMNRPAGFKITNTHRGWDR